MCGAHRTSNRLPYLGLGSGGLGSGGGGLVNLFTHVAWFWERVVHTPLHVCVVGFVSLLVHAGIITSLAARWTQPAPSCAVGCVCFLAHCPLELWFSITMRVISPHFNTRPCIIAAIIYTSVYACQICSTAAQLHENIISNARHEVQPICPTNQCVV